ncbi:hypothetical protein BSLG_005899 [Batrachochytrium salamandrivorans]|nr:hypothetical protein BSLG_005899 [Batrachochytrium salamandrivorans]
MQPSHVQLFFVGPSGSGKSTLLKRLFKEFPEQFGFSISRTSYQAVQSVLEQGKNVILDIDMQGVIQLQSRVQSGTSPFTNLPLCIFVAPPSIEKLKERLTGRGTETKDSAEARLNAAIKEMQWERPMEVTVNRRARAEKLKQEQLLSDNGAESSMPIANIIASCIQSRFHVDTLETLSKEAEMEQENPHCLLPCQWCDCWVSTTIRPLMVEQIDDASDCTILQEVNDELRLTDQLRIVASADRTARLRSGKRETLLHDAQERLAQLHAVKLLLSVATAVKRQIEHIQDSIAHAQQGGNMKQAMSRKKNVREAITVDRKEEPVEFTIPLATALRHTGTMLIGMDSVMATYRSLRGSGKQSVGASAGPHQILQDVSLTVDRRSYCHCRTLTDVVNHLMEIIAGSNNEAKISGQINRHPNLKVGYFAQSHVDSLRTYP